MRASIGLPVRLRAPEGSTLTRVSCLSWRRSESSEVVKARRLQPGRVVKRLTLLLAILVLGCGPTRVGDFCGRYSPDLQCAAPLLCVPTSDCLSQEREGCEYFCARPCTTDADCTNHHVPSCMCDGGACRQGKKGLSSGWSLSC